MYTLTTNILLNYQIYLYLCHTFLYGHMSWVFVDVCTHVYMIVYVCDKALIFLYKISDK